MEFKPNICDAAISLVGGEISLEIIYYTQVDTLPVGKNIGDVKVDGVLTYHDGQTPPTKSAIDTKLASMISDWDDQAYARNRSAEYPDWGEQFNKIYDDGLTKWKSEMVDPVKTKWPKDNSGPV